MDNLEQIIAAILAVILTVLGLLLWWISYVRNRRK